MATADEVIVVLEARLDQYERDLRRAERTFKGATDGMGNSIDELARDIKANSGAISSTLAGLAITLASVFSIDRISQFSDAYTRFTNQLRVSGLEGQALLGVQDQLFGIAQEYAIELESLGSLYGRAATVSRELGASQADLLRFTTAVSAALKIQGTDASAAQGALMQLGQALGAGTVRAEEFNSVQEGALPLLQAAARNIDAAGGSVARLKVLVNDGKVSSQQFFQAILAGTSSLEDQAGRAALTIGQAFTQLDNALGRYIGQTDASLGASQRLAEAIGSLANNLDFVAKAIATIAVALIGRYVVGTTAAFIGTSQLIAALSNLTAVSLGATGTATTLGVAMTRLGAAATGAGAAILRAFGGPVGLAITGLAAAFIFLGESSYEAARAQERQEEQQRRLSQVQEQAADIAGRLASASKQVRDAAIAEAHALRATTIQILAMARAQLFLAHAKAAAARIGAVAPSTARWDGGGSLAAADPRFRLRAPTERREAGMGPRRAEAELANATAELQAATSALASVGSTLDPPAVGGGGGGGNGRRARGGGSQRSAEDLARRERQWLDMLDRARIEELQAQSELESSIELRAVNQRKIAGYENDIALRAIDAQDDLSEARKEELRVLARNVAATREQVINVQEREATDRQRLEIAQAAYDNEIDLARAQMAFVETRDERLGLELRLVDLQHGALMAEQIAIRDNLNLSDEQRDLARRRIAVLEQLYGLEQRQLQRAADSPGQRYLRELGREARNQSDKFEEIATDGLESLNDGLVEAIMNTRSLGEVFKNVANQIISDLLRIAIRRAVIEPLANSLFGGGGSGGFGANAASSAWSAVQSFLPRFATGGSMMLGGRGGIDTNTLSLNGRPIARVSRGERMDIVPPGAVAGLSGARGHGGVRQEIYVDARGAVMNDQFARQILSQAKDYSNAAAGASYERSMRDAPGAVTKARRYGAS